MDEDDATEFCRPVSNKPVDIQPPPGFGRKVSMTALQKLSSSARRALSIMGKGGEQRNKGWELDVSRHSQQDGSSAEASSPRKDPAADLSFDFDATGGVPQPVVPGADQRPSLAVPTMADEQPPPRGAQITKPRSLLSALLKRPSSSNMSATPTPQAGPQVSAQQPQAQPAHDMGAALSSTAPVPSVLSTAVPALLAARNGNPQPARSPHPAHTGNLAATADGPLPACLSASYGGTRILGSASPRAGGGGPVPMPATTARPVPVPCPAPSPCAFNMEYAVVGSAGAAIYAGNSVPATSLLSSSIGPSSLARQLSEPQPLAPPQSAAAAGGSTQLLAVSPATPAAMLRSHWSLEDYSLHRRLYKGSMASVYKGRCLRSGMPVALKVYFKTRVPANVIHMVLREVNIHLQASEHRNVLALYGVFQTEELLVLVLELAPRGSLAGVCQALEGGRLTERELRHAVMEPLLSSLAYVHSRGVCHRDIKPENLLFASDWSLRLADFGVAINLAEERAVTRAGTADYMAPEVERCPLKANPHDNKEDLYLAYSTAADVWSVGVLAYELLVGFPPVLGRGGAAGPSLSFPASVSAAARDFIAAALAPEPEDRPTVQQLRAHAWLAAGAAAPADATR